MTVPKRAAAFSLALLFVLAGCSPAPPATREAARGAERAPAFKRVVAGIPSDPPFLYNKLNVGGVGGQGAATQDLVHTGLTAYDPLGQNHARLAESAEWRRPTG